MSFVFIYLQNQNRLLYFNDEISPPHRAYSIKQAFEKFMPEAELINILDDSLARDRAKYAEFTNDIRGRIHDLALYASNLVKADVVQFTCSAFGECIDEVNALFDVPVLTPNEAMFEEARAIGGKVALVATFQPSLKTMLEEYQAPLDTFHVPHAFEALGQGNEARHDALIADIAPQLTAFNVVMLAQFSMVSAAKPLANRLSLPVLTAPEAAVRKIQKLIGGLQ
jgi:Asp/Glu/Hydantoin racemase